MCCCCHCKCHPATYEPIPSTHTEEILRELREIKSLFLVAEKRVMAKIEDVNAALDQLGTSLSGQLTAIQTEIQQLVDAGAGATPAQLQAIVDRVNTLKTGVDDTIAQLAADDPAPPPPAPTAGSAASVP